MPLMHDGDRGSRRAMVGTVAALVVLAAAVCVLHREVLFGGHLYHMDDAADGYYPGHIAVWRAFSHWQLPTWERGSWCGWPLLVDPYNGVFYPLNVLYYVVGAARGLGYAVALHVFLGGVGLLSLLRRRGLSTASALFGGLAYELSTFGVVRIRHVIFVQMMAWLPWILVGVERYLASRRARDLAFTAAATGLALLAGALSIGHFAALAIAGYTVARCLPGAAMLQRTKRSLADAGALAGAAVLGAMLAAAQILPTLAHLRHSPRALASDYRFASSYAWPSTFYVRTLLLPDYFGGEDRFTYVGAPNHWELCGWYVGALCVALAPLGLLAMLQRNKAKRGGPELAVLAGLVLLAIGLALGDAGPVHPWFYRHVPLYAALRCPARALLMAVLALPILGGHGVEVLCDAAERRWRRAVEGGGRPWLELGARLLPALAVVCGALFLWLLLDAAAHGRTRLVEVGGPSLVAQRHLIEALAPGLAVAALLAFAPLPRLAGGGLLCVLLALDLLSVGRAYVALQHRPLDYPSGMERFAAVEWLRAHTEKEREPDGDGGADRMVNDPRGPFRLHNIGMVLGMENASGYDSVPIWRYVEFLYLLNTGHRYPWKELRDDFAAIGVHDLSSPLIDLMNVRWLLAGQAPAGDARWVERFRPRAPTGAPAAKYEPYWDAQMKVFENVKALPRAFVVHRAEVPGTDDALATRLAARDFDPGRTALLEEPPGVALDPRADATVAPVPARITVASRDRLAIATDDARPGVLIVSDAHYPGWSVTVDGAPAKLLRADWAFRGVALSAGHHVVEMRWRSVPAERGLLLSALALLATLALCAWPRRGGSPDPVL